MKRRNLYPLSIFALLAMLFPHLGFAQNNEQTLFKAVSPEYPTGIVSAGNQFFFTTTYNNDSKIWKSDGTSANTQPFLINDADGRISSEIVPFNNSFYFVKVKNGSEMDLWKTDGTTKTRVDRLMTLIQGDFRSYELSVKDEKLLFKYAYTLNNVNQGYLLQSTGATGGTTMIGQTHINYPNYSINRRFFIGNNNTVFYQEDSTITATNLTSQCLFVKDALGTRRILNAQTGVSTPNIGAFSVLNNELYYTDNSTAGGNALWKINASGAKVKIKAGFSDANPISNIGAAGKIYFQTIGNALWRTDGTAAGTIQVAPFTIFPSSINGTIYYHTNSYTAKIVNDAEVIVGQFPPNHQHLGFININNQIHSAFTGNDNSGYKLFKPNAGQYDLIGYIYGYNTLGYAVIGNSLYYQAFDNRFPNVAHAIYQLNLTPSVSKPDLAIKQADINLINNNNQYLNVSANFKNIGALASGTYKVYFYISSDTLIGNDLYTEPFISTSFAVDSTQNATAGYNDFSTLFKLPKLGTYYVIVKLDVDNTVSESNENNNIAYQSFTFGNSLCASKGTLPWEYWIGNVKFSSINNTSDKFKDFNTLGYSDYTNLTTTVSKGQSYPLSISPSLSWIGNVPNAYARAWIDFNNNNIFEANELVLEKNNANPLISNVLVPTNAVTGNVRMRVSVKFGSYPTACETFDKGEVEDYTVVIGGATTTCVPINCPSNINLSTTGTTAVATWTAPTLSGSCGGLVLVASANRTTVASGASFPIGTTRVRYNVFNTSDGRLVDSSCYFDVTVVRNVVNLPDLTLANLTFPILSVQQGQRLDWKVDIKNSGAIINNNFSVKSFISTDSVFSTDDIAADGIILSNIDSNRTLLQVAGLAPIPISLAVGNYFWILKADADNQVAESNENNNVIVSTSTFAVTGAPTNTNYCASKGTLPWEYWVGNVKFNSLNNTSDKFKDFATLGYSDYTSVSTPVNKGQSYPLSISPDLSWIGNVPNAYARAWIDFNNNNIFEANELVLEKNNANPLISNVLVPTNAVTGNVRMRVSVKFGSYPTACETFDRGEVEDYTIQITDGTGNNQPDLTLANLNLTNLSVPQGASMFYSFEFKNIGTAPAPNSLITVYISSDNVLSSDDVVVNNSPEIPAGTTSFQASSFVPTATVAVGSYYLILKADANNQIAESNENNNVLVSATKFTVTNGVNNSCRQQDSLQLVALYNATGGANWQTKWDLSKPITSWYGLSFIEFVNDNCLRVQKVLLDYNNLVGTIPNLNIPPLRELRLVGNKLTGAIPNFNLPNLEELYLNSNQLTGSVPNLTLPNLVKLELGDNQLTGTIPNLNLPNLEILGFAKNQLTGTVPNLNLPKLKYWYLETNLFTSVADLTLPNLELLYIDGNRLSGNVPNLNLLPKIYAFSLGNNQLTGNIPNFSQSTLQYMTLSANKLSGSIPNFNLPNIRQIYLANNQLSGTLPNFNQVPNLSLLNVSDNRLSGCLPSSLRAFCGNAFLLGNNPNLATQDFNAFCTSGTGACPADIALSITSTPSVFRKYTTQIFKIKAQNVGNQTLTNVKIEFKRPAQTSNGGAKVASIGTFSDFCPGGIECSEWTIPSLAAGATATLDAPVFILDPTTAIVATTKLLSSTPTDGNAANNTASITLTPAAPAPAIQSLSRQKPTQYLPIIVQSIAPNPTEGDVVVEVESLKEQVVQFDFSNTMGQIIRIEKRPLEKGTNQVRFDVYEFPDGVYLLQTDVNRGRISPTKFVKF